MNPTDQNCDYVPPVRRSPRTRVLMALYAIAGCLAVLSLLLVAIEMSIAFAAVALVVLAAYYPRMLPATVGAIVFVWTPSVLTCGLSLFVFPNALGEEMVAIVVYGSLLMAMPVAILVSACSALVIGLFFPVIGWRPGHCTNCDYNLRGLTSDRCPECGTMITPVDRVENDAGTRLVRR